MPLMIFWEFMIECALFVTDRSFVLQVQNYQRAGREYVEHVNHLICADFHDDVQDAETSVE
jgi:hypothetical protein